MQVIERSIDIAAAPDVVWASIVAFDAYQEWNPFIIKGRGDAVVGATLKIMIQPPGGKAMTFRPMVQIAEPGKHLRWQGIVMTRVVLRGQHEFILEPVGTGTRLVQREFFRGLAVPFIKKTISQAEDGFRAMNQALKERAEKSAGAGRAE